MPRKTSGTKPEAAQAITSFAELESLVAGFVSGHFRLLAIVGRPGLSKSFSVKAGIGANPDDKCLLVKGRITPIRLYEALYTYKDMPVILDDCDSLMADKLCRQYVKNLTESDEYRRLDWSTMTHIEAPAYFYTKSPVCIITNTWNSRDVIYQALESRAEFVWFDPDWSEVYQQVGTWFWDQQIFDYIHKRLHVLKSPDMRLFIKAYDRKIAKLPKLPWRKAIDNHCQDKAGRVICDLLDEPLREPQRVVRFEKETGMSRATYFRRKKEILSYRPTNGVERIKLKFKSPPQLARPKDGPMLGDSDDDDNEE